MTGAKVTAAEALALGLADEVVPDDDLPAAAHAFAAQLAAGPAIALSFTKRAVQRADEHTLAAQLEFESWGQTTCFKTDDFAGRAGRLRAEAPARLQRTLIMTFTDILYDATGGVATITINRPDALNALRTLTVTELIEAFRRADDDPTIGVAILTGAGDRAFCVGARPKGVGLQARRAGLARHRPRLARPVRHHARRRHPHHRRRQGLVHRRRPRAALLRRHHRRRRERPIRPGRAPRSAARRST